MEIVWRKSLFKAQFQEQEPVVDQGLLRSAIFYVDKSIAGAAAQRDK